MSVVIGPQKEDGEKLLWQQKQEGRFLLGMSNG
jgi:hypothetical protein